MATCSACGQPVLSERPHFHPQLTSRGRELAESAGAHLPPTRERRLERALRDLLEQIDCLDGIEYSKDTEPYKAEANWENALERARAEVRTHNGR